MKECFEKLYQKDNLTSEEMIQIGQQMFAGNLTESQISALLIALKVKGVTATEMVALAQVIQQEALQLTGVPAGVMDNCGTGGDHLNSFNVSTTAAFVLAAGGVVMAKHGNRSISSKSGSADVLEHLGITISPSTEKLSHLLREIGIAFLFAPSMHPKMKYIAKVRQELATPTILNLIGPLTNPVKLESQLMGTFAGDLLLETCETLKLLGRKRGVVIHGAYGMDEANLAGVNRYAVFDGEKVTEHQLIAQEVGLVNYPIEAIVGGDAARNAEILKAVLQNVPSPYLHTVLLNAGLGFFANGKVTEISAGVELARTIIASGAAYDKLQQLIAYQREVA
jgi:anthranilate phosphoribosyltransferase